MTGPVSVDLLALAPVLAPALGAVLVLVLDALVPAPARRLHLPLAAALLAAGAAATAAAALGPVDRTRSLCVPAPDAVCFHDPGDTGSLLQLLALTAGLVVVLLLLRPGPDDAGPRDEAVTAALVLATVSGATVVAAAVDLGSWLVGLELATLPAVALVALRGRRAAAHGALSLLLTSLVSFGLLVLGAALWVVATGQVVLGGAGVADAWADPARRPALLVGVLLMLAGLGFKVSAVPFHAWTPPAYAGSGPVVATLLGTVSKAAAVAGLVAVVGALDPLLGTGGHPHALVLPLALLAAVSMTIGNVVALRQDRLLRLLAWSTIAQSGWVLLPLAALGREGRTAATAYAVTLVLGSLGAFAALAHARATDEVADDSRASVAGLLRRTPWAGVALGLALLSLAGLPPGVVGLVGKLVALRAAVGAGLWWLAGLAVANVVLGIAAYLRWVLVLLERPRPQHVRSGTRSPATLAAVVLALGLLVVTSAVPQSVLGLLR